MRAHARISLGALRHNLQRVRQLASNARVMAVIKANAYGHGISEVAAALDDSDSFAVATVDEAVQLREGGIDKHITVLQGASNKDELLLASQSAVSLVVHAPHQLDMLESIRLPTAIDIWLKIDSGMHRLGFTPQDTPVVYERLRQCAHVQNIRIMSHFANADDPVDKLNTRQCWHLDIEKN